MPHRRALRPQLIHTLLLAAFVVAVAGGAFAFGSVYPWAYTPLAGACAAIGLAALVLERRGRPPIGGVTTGSR